MSVSKQKDKNGKLVKDKNGTQKYKVKINYKRPDGTTAWLTRICAGKNEADRLERRLIEEYRNKNTKNITFKKFAEYYFENRKAELRRTTYTKRQTAYRLHLAPYLDGYYLADINLKILTDWKNKLNQKKLAETTKNKILTDLKTMLNYAVLHDFISQNPTDKLSKFKDPNALPKEIEFYTPEEFKKYIGVAERNAQATGMYDYYVFFAILYLTGARKGEANALRWKDIDFENHRMYIKTSITQKLGKQPNGDFWVETQPKNKSSIRDFTIPQILIDILKEHRNRQQQTIANWNPDGFICSYFTPLRDTALRVYNRSVAAAADLKPIRIHDFRHSFVSFLINNNIPATEIAHRVGHSTTRQTLKTYSHLFKNLDTVSARLLDTISL